jgi:tRNA G18 (ribose-2'-O)-methylase SpoU
VNRKLSLEELNRLSLNEYKKTKKFPVVVVLDNLRSLNNVGSFFRTCDAFKIEKMYLTGITGCPPNKEIYKTALGAENAVEWEYHENVYELASELQKKGYEIVLFEHTKQSILLRDYHPKPPTALFFGNEVQGITESLLTLADFCVEIPQYGTKHSLNVAVSGGIAIYYVVDNLKNHS